MATEKELRELYEGAKYREVIAAENEKELKELWTYHWPGSNADEIAKKILLIAWSHHQVGEYNESIPIFKALLNKYESFSEIGESTRRGLAQGLLQRDGNIVEADEIMKTLPSNNLKRDELRSNLFLTAARRSIVIPAEEVMVMVTNALKSVPYARVNGHIINNGIFALYEAGKNYDMPYEPVLPGFILAAIYIYLKTESPQNHIASAYSRAAQIYKAAGLRKSALVFCNRSKAIWEELKKTQGGERYSGNLQEVLDLRGELEK
jgi:hypothetical protein